MMMMEDKIAIIIVTSIPQKGRKERSRNFGDGKSFLLYFVISRNKFFHWPRSDAALETHKKPWERSWDCASVFLGGKERRRWFAEKREFAGFFVEELKFLKTNPAIIDRFTFLRPTSSAGSTKQLVKTTIWRNYENGD